MRMIYTEEYRRDQWLRGWAARAVVHVLAAALIFPGIASAATATTALSAKAYVQTGIVAQWDAIENAGYGLHGDVATEGWNDLVGGCVLTANISSGGSVTTSGSDVNLTKASLRVYDNNGPATVIGNALGAAQKTIELAGQALSYVQNRFWFCVQKGSSNNEQYRIVLWYDNRGNLLDQYCLFDRCYNQSTYSFGIAANAQFTATTAFSAANFLYRYANGTMVAAALYDSGSPAVTTTTTTGISLHSLAYNSTPCTMNTRYSALRVYKRTLSPDEVAWNAMLDRHRFRGEDLNSALSTKTRRIVNGEVQLGCGATVSGDSNCGTVAVSCGYMSVGAGETLWLPIDKASETVTYTATALNGGFFCGWSGDNGQLTTAERLNPTLTLSALSAPTLVATFAHPQPVDYLESTGVQYIDCDSNFTYGHKFTLRWSQASNSRANDQDKGWGTGGDSTSYQYDICGGGRRMSDTEIKPYLFKDNRTFSPTLAWAALVIGDPYEDVCTVQNTTTYTMTHLSDGTVYSITAVATPNTTSYDSGNTINLFRDNSTAAPYYGKKRIYRATYETVGGDVVFDLFPVTVAGKPAYYDRVARKLHFNAAVSGADFTVGPASTSFRIAVNGDVEFAARASVDATGGGTVTLSDGTTTVGEGKSIWLSRGATGNFIYTATPDAGYAFSKWTGDTVGLTQAQVTSAALTVAATEPRSLVAVFGKSVSSDIIPAGAYVQNGLIAQWDGIENAGVGVQNTNLTSWIELKQNLKTTATALKFDVNGAIFNGVDYNGTLVTGSLPEALVAIKNGAFTADVCFNPTAYKQYAGLFHFGVNSGDRYFSLSEDIHASSGGVDSFIGAFQYKRTTWDAENCYSKTIATIGQVNSVAAVADGTYHRLYLAGAQCFTGNAGTMSTYNSTTFQFGRYLVNSQRATMRLHGVRFYNRVLTEDEIRLNAIVDRCRFASLDDVRYVGTYPSGHFECRIDYAPSDANRGSVECKIDSSTHLGEGRVWAAADQTVTLTPTHDVGYEFYCWEGDTNGTTIASDGVMTFKGFPRTLVARFIKSGSSPTVRTMTLASNATKEWSTASNWSPSGVPEDDDFVVISGYGTLILRTSTPALSSLTISGTDSSKFAYLSCSNWTTKVNANQITVKAYGAITTPATVTNDDMSNRVWLVCRDLDVQANGQINVNYKGYINNNGPGWKGVDSPTQTAGGAYGGISGNGVATTCAHCYGSVTEPEDLGSGGYRNNIASSRGSYGGGAIKIQTANRLVVNGGIFARGESAWYGWGWLASGGWQWRGWGGASGGSVYISTKTIEGSGTVSAAGVSYYSWFYGGGGGRVAVHYDSASQAEKSCLVTFSAQGSSGPYSTYGNNTATLGGFVSSLGRALRKGGDGSLYFTDNQFLTNAQRAAKGVLLAGVYYSGEALPETLVFPGDVMFKNSFLQFAEPLTNMVVNGNLSCLGSYYEMTGLALSNTSLRVHGNVTLKGAFLKLDDNRTEIDGDLTMAMSGTGAETSGRMYVQAGDTNGTDRAYGAEFYVGGTWTMEKNACVYPYSFAHSINERTKNGAIPYFECLNFDLHPFAYFDARQTGNRYGFGNLTTASYGASHGGKGGRTSANNQYGSAEEPICAGSGSATYRGGGAVRIHARNRMDVNGYVVATGNGTGENNKGGASGGSIYLSSARLSSTNFGCMVTVSGGKTGTSAGGGGGGRISIWSRAYLATNMLIYVNGGTAGSSADAGGAGSLYWYRNAGAMFLIR